MSTLQLGKSNAPKIEAADCVCGRDSRGEKVFMSPEVDIAVKDFTTISLTLNFIKHDYNAAHMISQKKALLHILQSSNVHTNLNAATFSPNHVKSSTLIMLK